MTTIDLVKITGVGLALAAACVLPSPLIAPAMAQATGMVGLGESDSLTMQATVTAIDQTSRMVTLTGAAGNSLTVKAGDQVRNLAQVKAGYKVIVRYHGAVAYVLAPPGTKLPDDSATGLVVGAGPGQMPAGAAAAKFVVTGLVVGVDPTTYTVQLIEPSGGMIRNVSVISTEGRQNMKMIKVGDTITAVITEAVAVAVEPTT
jgi:hypothetical protein